MAEKKVSLSCVILVLGLCLSQSATASLFSFFAPATPANPEILYPENGERFTVGDVAPDIQWTAVAGAESYELEFALDADFSAPFSLFSETSHLDFATLMDQPTWDQLSFQLYLHVRAQADSLPISDWSEPIEFAKTIAGAIETLSPVDDARFTSGDKMPVLEWAPLEGIDLYRIEFSQDADFEQSYGSFIWAGHTIDCNLSGDPSIWDSIVGTFYWRVCGLEGGIVPTPFSASSSFAKTTGPVPVLVSPENNTHFSISSTLPIFTWEPLPHMPLEYHIQFSYGSDPFPNGGGYIPVTKASFDFTSVGITEEMWSQFYGKLRWRVAGLDEYGNHGGFSTAYSFFKISAYNYIAFGDSITGGFGASDWGTGYAGYPPRLQSMLRQRYGQPIQVFSQQAVTWFPGGHTFTGDEKINTAMNTYGPFKVLIMFGIIDIVDPGACEDYDCHTIEHLSEIIRKVRLYHAVPYLATITPVNPESERADLQDTVEELNVAIRALAVTQLVPLVDMEAAFFNAPLPLEDYFTYDEIEEEPDWAHFNDLGYQIIAETWNDVL